MARRRTVRRRLRAATRTLTRVVRQVSRPRPLRRTPGRWIRTSYRGLSGARAYSVYLPAGHRRTTATPLLVLLHGCNQSSAEFVAATRFTALADRHGFVLAVPQQTALHQAGRCWRWYERAHQGRGRGEPAVLAGIAGQVLAERARWRIDPTRVYAAGISAGGAMALVLAATYPDVFAAVGVHSAPPYRSASGVLGALPAMRGRSPLPGPAPGAQMSPAIVFHGTADPVVHPRNGELVTSQWLAFDDARGAGLSRDPARITRSRRATGRSTDGRRHTVTRWYSARGRKQLEFWQVDGLGHAWSGGVKDGSYSDPRGPRASTTMWRFLAAHTA